MAARMLLASLEAAAQPAAILKAGSVLLQHCMSQDLSQVRNGLFSHCSFSGPHVQRLSMLVRCYMCAA